MTPFKVVTCAVKGGLKWPPPKKVEVDGSLNQRTLAAFKFTKTVLHRDEQVTVSIPEVIYARDTAFQCDYCNEILKNKAGLTVHLRCKHPKEEMN